MNNKILLSMFGLMTAISSYGQNTHAANFTPYFTAVVVKDIEASSQWYRSVLGLTIASRNHSPERGSTITVMEGPQILIELIQVKSSITPKEILEGKSERTLILGYTKIGFKIADIDGTIKYLKNLKVNFHGDIYSDPVSNKKSFLVNDPDGNLIQFFE